jgi:hypothetical protein
MVFAFVRRWWDPARASGQSTVELACGGRVALAEEDGQAVLTVTTAPDSAGRTHAAVVALSAAERAELSQALAASDSENPVLR